MFFLGFLGLIASFILKFVPFINIYRTPIQALSVILIVFGTYMAGAISNQEVWEKRVSELQVKVAQAEAESAKENVKIVEKIVTQTKVIKEKGDTVIKYVDREVVKYDQQFGPGGQCELPKEFFKALNDAAETPK
jgi:hypothetical protein